MFVRKNRHAPELSEANCHARLSHSKLFCYNDHSMMLTSFDPVMKRFLVPTPKKRRMTDCIYL